MDIAAWLRELGLGQYVEAFADNDITGDILATLSDDDLKTIGVQSLGHRKRLLTAAAASGQGTPVPADAVPDGERRPVTILFADLSGFTRLSGEIDAEEVHALLGRFFQAVDGEVQAQGGTIDKHIGDCTMALLGAPLAHGDDPQRAVRAAIGARDAVARLAAETGYPVGLHIGIAGGEVVASRTGSDIHSSYTVTGNSVNVAARWTDLAGDGEILIAKSIYRDVAGSVVADAAGALDLKGIEQPVEAWRLRKLAEADTGERGVFVGRRAELHQFSAALASCRDAGTGSTLLVRGEPGIGKTRLIAEFRRLAEAAGLICHTALVLDFGTGTGTEPMRMMTRRLLDVAPDADQARREAGARHAREAGLIDDGQEAFLGDLLDLPQPPHLRALIDALSSDARVRRRIETLVTLAERSGRRQPVLLVVEDIHWADPSTLEALAALAAATAEAPLLLVLTTRLEGDPLNAAWRAHIGGAAVMTVDLVRLREAEARELAAAVGGGRDLIERCLERAEGNPLFLE